MKIQKKVLSRKGSCTSRSVVCLATFQSTSQCHPFIIHGISLSPTAGRVLSILPLDGGDGREETSETYEWRPQGGGRRMTGSKEYAILGSNTTMDGREDME